MAATIQVLYRVQDMFYRDNLILTLNLANNTIDPRTFRCIQNVIATHEINGERCWAKSMELKVTNAESKHT